MRLTKEDFEKIKSLTEAGVSPADIARVVGCKANSVSTYRRYASWEEYESYKAKLRAYQAKKAPKEKRTLSDVFDMVARISDQLHELNVSTKDLLGWENFKQKQKEEYWKKQKEKKGYFNRWGNE